MISERYKRESIAHDRPIAQGVLRELPEQRLGSFAN